MVAYLIPRLSTRRREGHTYPTRESKPRLEPGIGGIEYADSGSLISVVANFNLILCFSTRLKLPFIKLPSQLEG